VHWVAAAAPHVSSQVEHVFASRQLPREQAVGAPHARQPSTFARHVSSSPLAHDVAPAEGQAFVQPEHASTFSQEPLLQGMGVLQAKHPSAPMRQVFSSPFAHCAAPAEGQPFSHVVVDEGEDELDPDAVADAVADSCAVPDLLRFSCMVAVPEPPFAPDPVPVLVAASRGVVPAGAALPHPLEAAARAARSAAVRGAVDRSMGGVKRARGTM
jgi:hypothetical protein